MPRNNPIPSSEIIGNQYGRLTVIRESWIHERKAKRDRSFVCQCECGNEYIGTAYQLLGGKVTSCGCNQHKRKHGHTTLTTQSRTYVIWNSMRQRINNPKASNYENYGGRGITMDERWNDFINFLADMGEAPSDTCTLDRKENELGYCKDNCKWEEDWSKQMRHTRQNRMITFKEQTRPLVEWVEITGLPRTALNYRLNSGWSVEDALTTPLVPRNERHVGNSRKPKRIKN